MSSDGIITIDFCDIGLRLGKVEVGSFSGSAEIDTDGAVVSVCFDGTSLDSDGKPKFETVAMNSQGNWVPEFVRSVAKNIEKAYADDIKSKLEEWEEEHGIEAFSPTHEWGSASGFARRL